MPSLAHCIELADLHPIEVKKLTDAAAAYRKEGFKAKEANTGAVKDFIKGLEAERTDVVKQIKGGKPELFKPEIAKKVEAPKVKPEIKPAEEPAKEDILFAERGGMAAARHTVESLKAELSERIGRNALEALDRGKKVRLITADEAVKLTGRPDLRESGIQGFYSNGIVYLIPENIDKGHGFSVLMHELGVHHGYQGIFGKKLAKEVFNAFTLKRYGDDKLGKAIARAFDRVPGGTPVHFRSEEAVAYFCEEHANIDLPLHRKIIARMRLWAVKYFGVEPDIFTHDDYVALAASAVRGEAKKAASAVRGEAKKAAREPVKEEVSREIFYSKEAVKDVASGTWYHGTPADRLDFGKQRIGNQLPFGVHFTRDKAIAESFKTGEARVKPIEREGELIHAKIEAKNPLDIRLGIYREGTTEFKILKEIASQSGIKDIVFEYEGKNVIDPNAIFWKKGRQADILVIKKILKKYGYDNAILYAMKTTRDPLGVGAPVYIDALAVLDENLVKQFEPAVTDIRYTVTGDPEIDNLFFEPATDVNIKKMAKYLRDNKDKTIRLYHGTDARIDILNQGLRPTSAKTAKSLQAARGFVAMSAYPGMARTFGEMAYPQKDIKVYAVDVPISELKADLDQLRNMRLFADKKVGNTLAESLLVGHGARVKGWVQPYMITEYEAPIEDVRYSVKEKEEISKFSVAEMPVEEATKKITDNPNFVKWFGDSKTINNKGEPDVLYHGTTSDFTEFSKEFLGESTEAPSAEKAFFFSGSPKTAENFSAIANNQRRGLGGYHYDKKIIKLKPILQKALHELDKFVTATYGEPRVRSRSTGKILTGLDAKKELKELIKNKKIEVKKLEKEMSAIELSYRIIGERIYPVYLKLTNPLIYDFKGGNRLETYNELLTRALNEGRDGVIFKNTYDGEILDNIYAVFEPTQIKSIFNVGTFDPTKADIRYSAKEKKDLRAWADNLIKSAKDHGVILDREPPSPERLRETSMSILSGLDASKLGGSARSFLKGLDPKGKGYGAAIEKWLASPEWYQHPVLKKIVDCALDKSEKFHNTFNEFNAVDDPMAEHDTVAKTLEALARKGGISKAAFILGKTSSDFKKLETLLDDADVYGEKHTVESLKKDGYNPDVIQAWSVVRESYDKQLDALIKPMKDLVARIKEQAAFMGTEPVYPEFGDFIIEGKKRRLTLQEAVMEMGRYRGTYSPRMRERGAWVVTGKIEKSIAEGGTEYFRNNRKSKSFANLLRDDLKRQGYTDIKVEKESKLPEETFQAIRMAEMGTMIGHAASKGLDKYDGEMQMAFMDEIVTASADMIKSRGARATMIRRREGMAVKGYVTDPLIRFVRYTGTNAAGIAKAEMAEKMIKDLYGTYEAGKKVGGIDATKEGEVHSMARAYIEEQLRNTEAGDRAVGILKGLTTLKFLGFNPRSILVNLSSLTTSVPMSLHTYAMDGKGSLLRIGKFLSIGCKDYTKIMAGKQLTDTDEATFIDNFRNSGYTDAQYTRDATGMVQGAYGTSWSKLMGGSMYAFGKSEEWVRGGTALAAYRLCRKQGLSHINAEKKAINATAKAHGTYGKETLPMVAWGKGVGRLGQAFYTYLKFPHNYMQMLYDAGIRKKNIKGVIFGMAAPAVLGGVAGVPMFSTVMAIANTLLSLIDDDRDAEKFVYDTLNEYFGEKVEKLSRTGILGLLDVDITGSLSMGPGAIPTSLFELTGAVGGMAQDIYRGGKLVIEGEYGRAFEKLVPKAIGNIALAIREIREGATTGRGDRVWDEEGRPYMPTPSETAKRALGFRSARRALLAQSTWVTKREERRFKETRTDIYRKIKYLTAGAENVRIDKETSDKISRYNKNALKTSNVTLISPASVEYQIAKMDTPTSKQKARVTQSERAATFEGDIWADALGVTDEPDTAQAEVKRLSGLGILKYSAPPSRNINAGYGIEVKLDDDQYSRYVADTSAIIKLAMDRLVVRSEWQKWSDKKKAFAVKRVINKGRKIVRDRLKETILKARLKRR